MPSLRALITAALILSLLPVPVRAAATGRIEGRVTNETTGRTQPNVRVVLTIGEPGRPEARSIEVTTDRLGRYLFDGLETGPERIYAIDAFFDGGMFSGGALTLPDDTEEEPVVSSRLRVWATTTDPGSLLIARDSIFLQSNEDGGVGAIESVTVANTSSLAYIGRGGDDEGTEPGRGPTVGFSLPAEADNQSVSIVDAEIDVPALISTEYGFAITTALPPGETRFTFSYPVEGITGSFDISRRALYPIAELDVFAAPPLEVESNRLQAAGAEEVGGKTYQRFTSPQQLAAGDSIQVVAVAEAGVPAGLLAGMAGVLLLVVLLGAIPFVRSRRRTTPSPRTRDDLVRAIAALDIAHTSTEMSTEEWAERRAELKAELAALDEKEMARR